VFRSIISPSIKLSRIRTSIAEVGAIEGTITASGVVTPEFEQVIICPMQSNIDSVFHKAGDKIEIGEPILKLNNEFSILALEKLQDEYELKKNNKTQLQLAMERELIDLRTQLDIMKLNVKSYEAKLDAQEQIYELGGGAKTNYDQAKLNLEIACLERDQLKDRIENHQRSLHADLIGLDLQLRIQANRINELERQLDLAQAKAVRSGVITWVKDNIGENVNQGEIIARIADLDKFKIESKISDIHAVKLIVGNPVKARVNDIDLSGKISSIEPTIINGIITFFVELEDKTNEMLRSNLRVDVFVITSSKDNIVRVKNGPFINGSGKQDIFVVKGTKAIRRTVIIGATNFDYAEVESGIKLGEEVIISDMDDYINYKELKIKQ
jgi:HlyD family secretion protein